MSGRRLRWTPEHDALLVQMVGTHDVPTMARIVSEHVGTMTVSTHAILGRLSRLGVRPVDQATMPKARGRHRPSHTPELGIACRCGSCNKRRGWTPERRAAMSARVRSEYADGRRTPRRDFNEQRAEHWQPQHDALLRELAPDHDCLTIARRLTARFSQPRTATAVKHRFKTLGISRMSARPLSASEVGRIFGGLSRETVRKRFVLSGLMPGTLRRGGPHGMRMFSRGDLEQLVREHPEAYDVETIRDAELRVLAVAVSRGRRLVPTSEVIKLTGVPRATLVNWYARGLVPTARRVYGVLPGRGGAWLIEAGDVVTVRQLRDGRAAARRTLTDARRDPLTGSFLGAGEIPSPGLRCALRIVDLEAALGRLVSHG